VNQRERIILALMQIENLLELSKGLQYTGFLTSHLLPIKYEYERQLVLLTPASKPATVQTVSPEVNG
jgi:hypothetical protein